MSQMADTINVLIYYIKKHCTKNECNVAVTMWYDTFCCGGWDDEDVMIILLEAQKKVCNDYAKEAIQTLIEQEKEMNGH